MLWAITPTAMTPAATPDSGASAAEPDGGLTIGVQLVDTGGIVGAFAVIVVYNRGRSVLGDHEAFVRKQLLA